MVVNQQGLHVIPRVSSLHCKYQSRNHVHAGFPFLYMSKRSLAFTIELDKRINPTPSETQVCLAFPLPSEPRSTAYKSGRLLCVPRVGNMGQPNLIAMRTNVVVGMADNQDLGARDITHRFPIIRVSKDYD